MVEQFISQLRLRATPPAVPAGLVRRLRVGSLLAGADPRPVTLLCAGPGSGKTLAVASWLAGDAYRDAVAWLTVDESDNDLPTFWSDVLGALALSTALPENSPLRELVPAAAFGGPEAVRVRAGLADLPQRAILVLDDFQEITAPAVLESLNHLIDHQPPNLRLVLVTRSDPTLHLHPVRVGGGLTEIRSEDLAFTEAEAAELFRRSNLQLTGDQVRVLLDRTQGWPAGLRLAAMSLATTDATEGIARFTGTDKTVAEYLIGEVLDRLPPQDREFLLRTSIADRLSPALATVLTGRQDSQLVLDSLATAHAFVIGTGGPHPWFRYHPLMQQLLQHRLALEHPGAVDELHLRASQWFTDQGEPIASVRHATLARNWVEVGRILTGTAMPLILTSAGPALAAALEPAAIRATRNPELSTLLAAATFHFQRHDFATMQRDARAAAEFLSDADDDLRIPAEILLAAMALAVDRARAAPTLVDSSARLLSLLDRAPPRLIPTAPHYRAIGLNNLGVGQLWAGAMVDAKANLSSAAIQARELGVGMTELNAVAHLAMLQVIRGDLQSAYREADAAQEAVDRRGWAAEPQALGLYVALGMTLLAWNRLAEASDVIAAGLAASSTGSDAHCRLALGIAAVGVAVARGDVAAARSTASLLGVELARIADGPRLLARWCAVAQAEARLTGGDPIGAIASIEVTTDDSGYPAALERIVLAKAELALGRPHLVNGILDPLLDPDLPFLAPAVGARVLISVAAARQNRDTAALAAMTEAIDLAQPEGLLRPFVDAGPAAARLIARYRQVVSGHPDFTRDLLPAPPPAGHPRASIAPERLTERELIVLRYLPTMLKSAEIAEDLYLSVNTVKSHQRAIYRKLDVTTRRAAVVRAGLLNLL